MYINDQDMFELEDNFEHSQIVRDIQSYFSQRTNMSIVHHFISSLTYEELWSKCKIDNKYFTEQMFLFALESFLSSYDVSTQYFCRHNMLNGGALKITALREIQL